MTKKTYIASLKRFKKLYLAMNPEKQIDKSVEDLLLKIEQECNDEPDTLLMVEASNYTTEHLFQLRGRWQKRNEAYKKQYRITFSMGALSPLFFVFGMLGFVFSPILGVIFLPLSICSFFGFLFGIFSISARFKSLGYQNSILQIIDRELKKRGQFVN
jgi:hypothetical protein